MGMMRRCTATAVGAGTMVLACSAVAATKPPTVTDTVNTCQGLTKPTDVAVDFNCRTLKTTYSTKVRVIAKAIASAHFATVVQKDGEASGPLAMYVRAIAPRRQERTVIWSLVCTKHSLAINGDDEIELSSGSFDTRSAVRRQIHMPLDEPDSCTFDTLASTASGTLRLRVLARVRAKVIKREVVS